jgi:RNA polymerase sigma factor (sigma-70 family)
MARFRADQLTVRQRHLAGRNVGLAYHVRNQFSLFPDQDGLLGECMAALVKAARCYDPRRGIRFSTYAVVSIRRRVYWLWERSQRRAGLAHFRALPPSDEMMPAAPDEPDPFAAEDVRQLLRRLSARERQVIRLRFGLGRGRRPMLLAEIGAVVGLGSERVRQIERRALKRMRRALEPAGCR